VSASAMPKKATLLLITLATVQFTNILDFVIMMPLGPQLMRVFDISPSQFGLLVSSYTFSASISGLISAFFIDKFDRKKALMFVYAGFIIGTLCCGLSLQYEWLLASRIVAGAFGGLTGALIMSIIGDVFPEEKRGMATGAVMSSFAVSSIVGVPLGLFLANHWGWHSSFFLLSGLGCLALFFAWISLPALKHHLAKTRDRSIFQEMIYIVSHPNHVKAFFLTIVMMFAAFSIIPFLSPYSVSNVGLKETDLPYIYFVGGLFTLVSTNVVGRLADKLGKYKVFAGMCIFSIIPVLLVTHVNHVPLPLYILCSTLFMISMSGRMIPAMAMITSCTKPEHRGGFMSINNSIQQMASGLAAFMGGLIIHRGAGGEMLGFDWIGYISVAILLVSIPVARRLRSE
jgi:predicted MFS family arabinose efflux permease